MGCGLVLWTKSNGDPGLHGVARVKEMEMTHCISYALGHPRTIGVSALGGFFRELFRRVDQQYYLSKYVHYNIGGLSTRYLSHPDSRSDPIGGSEPSSGCETMYWDSLPDFFFLKPNLYLWVWPTSYNRIKTSYTYRLSPIYIFQNCTFTFTNQNTEPTVMNPY